ncbi:MAG: YkgJ family cysteine cluster protein [Candidatus Heimdallarchaeota archaeon]|nr:YkgJ family cysteine cluster protein [Candidatus Heimdallarchaeota archaeon]
MTDNEKNPEEIREAESNNKEEKTQESTTSEEKGEQKKKYVFNCTKCGQCCEKREIVPVTLSDIRNWTHSGIINSVFPYLKFRTIQRKEGDKPQELLALGLVGQEKGCPMYDNENKLCNIYHSMPHECKAFPLGYNGQNYYIKDKSVPGLGNGTMTKEKLIQDRDWARMDWEARLENQMTLPLLYSLFMQNLLEQQQKAMEEMPEEKRKQLDELLKTSKE